ncbi:MAG: SDR family NAD(P)-dependent oxidoreductase [Flavobacteriales bacterium]
MKHYVIVGGSKGIGKALAMKLAEQNKVWVLSRSADEISGINNITHQSFDALNDEVSSLPELIHGLAYCPGSINLMPFHRIKAEQFQQEININLMGAIKVILAALPGLKAANGSSVVTFSTVAVQTGMPFHASIAAAKGAVEGLTRSLAAEYAANNIRFNCIAPSLTNTSLAEKLLASEEKQAAAAKRHPIGRFGEANDIAALAAFLLSDNASWITGQVLHADGGMSSLRML